MKNETENILEFKYTRKPGKKYRVDWQEKEYLLEYEHEGRYKMIHHKILDDDLYAFWEKDLAELEEAEERWLEEQIELQNDPEYQKWLAEQYEEWYEEEKEYYRSPEGRQKEIPYTGIDHKNESTKNDDMSGMDSSDEEFVPILDQEVEIINDFDPDKASKFPVAVLPSVVSNYIKEISRMFSIPYEFSAVPTLVAVSTAIGNNVTLQFNETLKQKAILYCCLVSQSSSGKSPAQKLALAPLVQQQSRKEKDYLAELAKYNQSKKNKDAVEELEAPIEPEDFITTNVTVEKLVEMLHKNSKGVVIACDEFMNFYKNLNGYKNGGGDLETYLTIWTNAYIKANRLSRKTFGVDSPYVNIIGNMTPSSLSKLAENDNLDNGFIHRLLFSCPIQTEMVRTSEKGIDPKISKKYNEFIKNLHSLNDKVTISLSAKAKNVYLQYEDFVSKRAGTDDRLRSSYSKIKEYALRFALILHVSKLYSENKDIKIEVSNETMAEAIKISEYFRSQLNVLYGQIFGNSTRNKAEGAVDKAISFLKKYKNEKGKMITKREFCRGVRIKIEEADEIVIPQLLKKEIINIVEKKETPRGESITFEILDFS